MLDDRIIASPTSEDRPGRFRISSFHSIWVFSTDVIFHQGEHKSAPGHVPQDNPMIDQVTGVLERGPGQ
jgi:hypothetical protein